MKQKIVKKDEKNFTLFIDGINTFTAELSKIEKYLTENQEINVIQKVGGHVYCRLGK